MINKLIASVFILSGMIASAQEVAVSSGKVQRFPNFKSEFIEARNVDVWLPEGYSAKEKYAVLYMHDGQMLFDANTTWNKVEWMVDETASKLITEKRTRKFIVVGIASLPQTRHSDLFPQKAFESLPKKAQDSLIAIGKDKTQPLFGSKIDSDNYLKFMVKELKPFIDKTYSVKTDSANTFVAGSSMGGLISMYAICEYPKVFGGAACISTHWPGTFTANNLIPDAFFRYLGKHLPDPKNHKIYFDYGDQTLDALYPPLQKKADAIMAEKGFSKENWITKFFPGAEHSEKSWAERLAFPLEFLLKQ